MTVLALLLLMAQAAELEIGDTEVGWSTEPTRLHFAALSDLSPGPLPATAVRTIPLDKPLHDLVSWHNGWIVLLGSEAPFDVTWLGPASDEPVAVMGASDVVSAAVDPFSHQLVLGGLDDTLTWIPWFGLHTADSGETQPALPGEEDRISAWREGHAAVRQPSAAGDVRRTVFAPGPVTRLVAAPGVGLVLSAPDGIVVLAEWMTEDQTGTSAVRAHAARPIGELLWADSGRAVTLGTANDGSLEAVRWSVLQLDLPLPMPLGTVPLQRRPWGALPLAEGLWLVDDGPLRAGPQGSSLQLGAPEGALAVRRGSPRSQELVWLWPSGPRRQPSPHPLAVAQPATDASWASLAADLRVRFPQGSALARDLRAVDLPIGPEAADRSQGGPISHESVRALVASATVFYQTPLTVAENFLRVYQNPDDDLAALIAQQRTELRDQSSRIALGAAFGAILLIWLMVVANRRARERQVVLAASFNPFREDSPDEPSRTPFSSDRLVDDVLRTLHLNCVVVEAPPFSGKSALLKHLMHRLQTDGLGGQPVRVVHLPLGDFEEDAFWTELGTRVCAQWPDEAVCGEVLEEESLDRATVEYLLDELFADDTRQRLVLVLDDLDQLGLYTHEAQRFRGLIQVIPSHKMGILAAGTSIRRGWRGDADESPWFNIFQVRKLHPWSRGELSAYLSEKLVAPFSFAPDVPTVLHDISGGRPIQVWHLCYAALERLLLERRFVLRATDIAAASSEVRVLGQASGESTLQAFDAESLPMAGSLEWEEVLQRIGAARAERDRLLHELAARSRARQASEAETGFFALGETED